MARKPILLTDFTKKVAIKGLDTPILEYTVPRGYVVIAHDDMNFRLTLPALAYDVVVAGEETIIVVSCPGLTHFATQTADQEANVEIRINGTVKHSSDVDVTSIAPVEANNEVTLTMAGATLVVDDNVDVFYPFDGGKVSIRRISPQALDSIYDTIFSMPAKRLNESEQGNALTAFTKLDKRIILPEMFKFAVYIKNDSVVCGFKVATLGGEGTDLTTALVTEAMFWTDMVTMEKFREACKGYDPAKLVVKEMVGGKEA